jgi:electron transfer flavoprotein alpha subunit
MEKVALLIELKAGRVKKANFGMATLGRRSGKALVAFVFGPPEAAEEARAALAPYGVGEVLHVRAGAGPQGGWNPAVWAAAAAAAMEHRGITQLVGLTTPQGKDLLPRIAALLDAPLVMDCLEADLQEKTVKTTQYSGKTVATIKMSGRRFIYGLRPNAVEPENAPVEAALSAFDFTPQGRFGLEVLETRTGGAEGPNLAEAEVILSGGRGLKGGENFRLLADCARLISGAAVGASRVAVDLGWVPYRMQVGQTGVKVNPKVYIACGISGSVQHFAGMKSAGLIIAINTDPDAAIMAKCDYFAVTDLFEFLPEFKRALSAAALQER